MSLSDKSFSLFKRDVLLFATNLVTGVVVARMLGPTVLGLWIILQMILAYAEGFGRLQWDEASIYLLGRRKYDISEVVFTLNAAALIMSSLIIGVVLWQFELIYHLLFAKSALDVRLYMSVILLQVPLQFLNVNYTYLHIFREDVRTYNGMVILRSLLSSLLGITLLVVFKLGLMAVVASSILSVFVSLAYGVLKFGATKGPARLFNASLIQDLLRYGSVLYVTSVLSQLNAYVTRLIVVFLLAPAQVAYFAMAQNQGQLLNKVPDALNALLYTRISKTVSPAESSELTARAFRIVLLILAAAGAVAFFVIYPVVWVLYGESFLAMVVPLRILLPGLVLSGSTSVLNQYFTGVGRADIRAKIALIPLLIQVPVAFILIPTMGLAGAAIAAGLGLLALSVAQVIAFLRISTSIHGAHLLIGKQDVRDVAAFIRFQVAKVA